MDKDRGQGTDRGQMSTPTVDKERGQGTERGQNVDKDRGQGTDRGQMSTPTVDKERRQLTQSTVQPNSTIKHNSASYQNRQTTNIDDVKNNADILAIIGEHVALKKVGHEWEGCCPFHNERTPSFKVDPNKGLWNCFGCGKGGDVIAFVQAIRGCGFNDAVDELDGNRYRHAPAIHPKSSEQKRTIIAGLPVPDHAPPPLQRHRTLGVCTGMWEYRNDIGQLVEYRYRFDLPDRKIILPLSWCRNEKTGAEDWDWKQAPAPRPLYRLYDILSRPDAPILIVEGEKTADAAVKIFQEYVVTTSSGGSNAADSSDWSHMAGRYVVIWPDNDAAGRKYAEKVKSLACKASEIRIVHVPEIFQANWDLADPLPNGWTLEMVRSVLANAGKVSQSINNNHIKNSNIWESQIMRTRSGPTANMANVLIALRNAPEWQGVFGFNEFSGDIEIISAPPWADDRWKPDRLHDVDMTRAAVWMQMRRINVSSNLTFEAIREVAFQNPFHPVRDFLSSLKWDRIKRLDHWLADFVGAADNEYSSAVGRKWLISAVARAFEPGCKVDSVLILEGKQGIGKSTVFRTIAGKKWFCDYLPDIKNKDAAIQLQGVWILEHAELDTLNRSEISSVKQFITTQDDKFREPYARTAEIHPRGCVFAGSVNPGGNGYLKDITGARRFWPVVCTQIDRIGLADARDQLLAEAVVAYHAGENWYLSPELEDIAAIEQDERLERDEWATLIEQYIYEKNRYFVSVGEILEFCFRVEKGKWAQIDQNRVAKCLKLLKWVKTRRRIDGGLVWGYAKESDTRVLGFPTNGHVATCDAPDDER
ncbi:MAG: CHC2 zinc finger domain-containing protein [Magnetococcus sp. YQC-5]